MSGNNNDPPEQGSTGGGQGGQQNAPSQGPPSGQGPPPGQGQPAGGQPAGGQPQGGYQGGRAPAHQEGIGDIFSKPTTMNQIKVTVVFYLLLGFGVGIAAFIFVNQFRTSSLGSRALLTGFQAGVLGAAFVMGPLLAVPVGTRISDALADTEQDNLIYATAGIATLVGNVLFVLVFRMVIALEVEGPMEMGAFFITSIVGGIGAAVVAIGAAYMVLNLDRR